MPDETETVAKQVEEVRCAFCHFSYALDDEHLGACLACDRHLCTECAVGLDDEPDAYYCKECAEDENNREED